MQKVYIETTIVSYLTAWPSKDVVIAAHQQITDEWWLTRRDNFDLCVSQIVINEASQGDPIAAAKSMIIVNEMTVLQTKKEAIDLAKSLLIASALPEKAANDALHIAVAAVHDVPFLLTWNCKHLANATMRHVIEDVCIQSGFRAPIICTPEELLEDY